MCTRCLSAQTLCMSSPGSLARLWQPLQKVPLRVSSSSCSPRPRRCRTHCVCGDPPGKPGEREQGRLALGADQQEGCSLPAPTNSFPAGHQNGGPWKEGAHLVGCSRGTGLSRGLLEQDRDTKAFIQRRDPAGPFALLTRHGLPTFLASVEGGEVCGRLGPSPRAPRTGACGRPPQPWTSPAATPSGATCTGDCPVT